MVRDKRQAELGMQVKLHLVLEGVLLQHMPEHASLHKLVANGDSFCIRVCNACFSQPSHRLCACKTIVVLALCVYNDGTCLVMCHTATVVTISNCFVLPNDMT